MPELTVQASDNITGLEKNQYVTYEWKIYNDKENNNLNKIEKNKTTFNTKDGASSTAEKKVRIVEEFKKEGSTGKAVVDLSGDNIIDRAGNKLSIEEESATETCTYYFKIIAAVPGGYFLCWPNANPVMKNDFKAVLIRVSP